MHAFCRRLIFFSKSTFSKKKHFRNTIKVSNGFNPDQARFFVGPDLGPDCLQRISADDTSRERVKTLYYIIFQWNAYVKCLSHFDHFPDSLSKITSERSVIFDFKRQTLKKAFDVSDSA